SDACKYEYSVRELKSKVDKILGAIDSQPKERRPAPSADPLVELWSVIRPEVTVDAVWEVGYLRHGTWAFQVTPDAGDYAGSLADWFDSVAKAIKAHASIYKEEPLSPGEEAEEAKRFAEVKAADEIMNRCRIPQTTAERQELEAAARQGPFAFFS